jgi:hypothetical protein
MNSRQKEAGKPASAFGIREGSEQQTENRAVSLVGKAVGQHL